MATIPPSLPPRLQLARTVRERYLGEVGRALIEISVAVQDRLTALLDEPTNARESQARRDAWMAYKRCRPVWVDATTRIWRESLIAPKKKADALESGSLELVGDEAVEHKILSSRLVQAVNEKVSDQLDDLRLRVKFLEGTEDLPKHDLLRPDVLVLHMVEQWAKAGMPPDSWRLANEAVQRLLIERLKIALNNSNEALIKQGVMPTIEFKDRVKSRAMAAGPRRPPPLTKPPPSEQVTSPGDIYPNYHPSGPGGFTPTTGGQRLGPQSQGPGGQPPSGLFGGRLGWGDSSGQSGSGPSTGAGQGPASSGHTPFWKQTSGGQSVQGRGGIQDETRMLTATTPLARARVRAQGMLGQIRQLFVRHAGPDYAATAHYEPSPALAAAIAYQSHGGVYASGGTLYEDFSPAGVARVAVDLREKSSELKKKAETKTEKATIEIVALMFQAILAEERIPPGIRVWFARLQMPVLRVALADPDFFGTATHPARMLIDRMGSCVMGFDAAAVQGNAMEAEIRRIVQVVEQYPETGKKVYQIVYDEFQKFLAKHLTEKGPTNKAASVAQQVEQKETLTIQYTIEMRNMLKDVPVREEMRDFLFKVWAEVLAVAAVRKGAQHADTLLMKKTATDLLWAASAKPNRSDRARVIQDLPNLLQRLRSGMALLGVAPSDQEAHIKTVSDIMADAFLSKTQPIPQEKIDAMAQRLGNLEDFLSEDGLGDLPLDTESIEMMLGIDATSIEVVTNGGSKPTMAMVAWAQELQPGTWYTLDHNHHITQVQFAWRSDRKQLNLFAATSGKCFLIQAGRLAAYLQAGLLLPQEEESLTVRATRDALTKLEANPERLLA
jgi:hypothetical protein